MSLGCFVFLGVLGILAALEDFGGEYVDDSTLRWDRVG